MPTGYISSVSEAPIGLGTGAPGEGLPGTGTLINPGGTSGPRGVEAVIEFNGLYMNVREWIDTYLITNIGGLDDADVRDSREVNPGYHGEQVFKGYYGGRTLTFAGKIYTKTLAKLRDMQMGLRAAFADLDNEYPLIFRASDPTLDMQILCRKSQAIQMAEEQRTANHFERAFQVTVRASNPRFLSVITNRSNIIFSSASFNGIVFSPTNNGNFPSLPSIELTGPIGSGLTIQNESNGDWVSLTTAIPAGEKWIIDGLSRRMYRDSDGQNRFRYLDVNSDWMELLPYRNNIRVTATGLTSGTSQLSFLHHHTYM